MFLSQRKPPVMTHDAVWAAVQDEWKKIKPEVVQNLYNSMQKRVDAVIAAKGHPTRY